MKRSLTFDDVLLVPKFSKVKSRKDVDLGTTLGHVRLKLPIISSNMDTITGVKMAQTMADAGAVGCLHRFLDVHENVCNYIDVKYASGPDRPVIVSVGLGDSEIVRAKSLYEEGASMFCLDVAHGAQLQVVEQYHRLKHMLEGAYIIVGNFANVDSTYMFAAELGYWPDAIKVGIGPGSACTTRIKTGVGVPQLSAIMQHAGCPTQVIADGGCRSSGDIVKALAAGAHAVMLGGMLAGTKETPGEVRDSIGIVTIGKQEGRSGFLYKQYRGSASKESYAAQGKDEFCITAEGESFTVPYRGPVRDVLADIEGGIRSAMTYLGASTLEELRRNAEFIEVSGNTVIENSAHGKKQ